MHDSDCNTIQVNTRVGDDDLWSIPSDDLWRVPDECPVVGWRQATLVLWRGRLVAVGWFDSSWEVPVAGCDRERFAGTALAGSYRDGGCVQSPHPDCQCGYRLVRRVADLAPLIRFSRGDRPDRHDAVAVDVDYGWVRPVRASPDDGCVAVLGLVEAFGWGRVTAAEFRTYFDPAETLRVQRMRLTGNVLVDDQEAFDLLAGGGFAPSMVPGLRYAHEHDRCDSMRSTFTLHKAGSS